MDKDIQNRFVGLTEEGTAILSNVGRYQGKINFWLSETDTVCAQDWLSRTAFFLKNIMPFKSHYREELEGFFKDNYYTSGTTLPSHTLQKVLGLLSAVSKEYNSGTLKEYEYIIFASAFDDFLDHAEDFHKGGKRQEGAVLSSIVLEDTIKKLCKKHDVEPKGVEDSIDALTKAGVFTDVKAKRIKGLCGVRNKALHADWDGFDLKELGLQIQGVKDLIADFL